MLNGYSLPLSPRGLANLAPDPPWHYAGNVLAVEYRADPTAVAAVLPPGLEPGPDPGRCVAHFVDWQFATDDGQEFLDPVRSQYAEFFVLVAASYGGEAVLTCPYIFVTQDVSLMRGLVQGFPKRLGSVCTTRAFAAPGRAAPILGPGGTFAGTLAVEDRRLAEAAVTIEATCPTAPGLGTEPVLNVRHFPELAAGRHRRPAVHELVRLRARDWASTTVWKGTATLRYFASPTQELHDLAPVEVGAGYRYSCSLTVDDLTKVRDLRLGAGAGAEAVPVPTGGIG